MTEPYKPNAPEGETPEKEAPTVSLEEGKETADPVETPEQPETSPTQEPEKAPEPEATQPLAVTPPIQLSPETKEPEKVEPEAFQQRFENFRQQVQQQLYGDLSSFSEVLTAENPEDQAKALQKLFSTAHTQVIMHAEALMKQNLPEMIKEYTSHATQGNNLAQALYTAYPKLAESQYAADIEMLVNKLYNENKNISMTDMVKRVGETLYTFHNLSAEAPETGKPVPPRTPAGLNSNRGTETPEVTSSGLSAFMGSFT